MSLDAKAIALISVGVLIAAAGVLFLMVHLVVLFRKRMRTPILPCTWIKAVDIPTSNEQFKNFACRVFTYKEIEECCEGFSNLIGQNSSHNVYKGTLADGTEVAVKRPSKYVSESAFHVQVDVLSRMHHLNLANLIGFCEEKQQRMLVFEYAPNGSLYNNLHNEEDHLTWKQRMHVAVGTASALTYMHETCGFPIAHGDLTSWNILLTDDFAPKVCGMKLPLQLECSEIYPDSKMLDKKTKLFAADVYSFGILLLEIISGKSAFSKDSGVIVEWAGQFLQSRDQMMILADPTLKTLVPLELYSVCEIARLCIEQEPSSRPSMGDVHYMLVQSLGMGVDAVSNLNNPVVDGHGQPTQ